MAYLIRKRDVHYKSKTHEVEYIGHRIEPDGTIRKFFIVKSSTSSTEYQVELDKTPAGQIIGHCNCDWGKYRPHGSGCGCSHVQAALAWQYERQGFAISAWNTEEDAKRQGKKIVNIGDGVWLTLRKIGAH